MEILWEDAAASELALGKNFDRVASLLKDLEDERDDITVTFR